MADRNVLITGVAGHIGRHLAAALTEDGWKVYGIDRRPPEAPVGHSFTECDLSDPGETAAKIAELHLGVKAFDAVINCAGLIASAPLVSFVDGQLTSHDPALWDRVISSCLSSAFYVTAATVLKMVGSAKRGVVINISSVCAQGNAGQVAYSAAKAGMNGMTAALAKELGPMGIRVVGLAPGYFDTPSTVENVAAPKLKEIKTAVPLRRLGKVDDLASAVRFILANGYVNGTIVELDGGLTL